MVCFRSVGPDREFRQYILSILLYLPRTRMYGVTTHDYTATLYHGSKVLILIFICRISECSRSNRGIRDNSVSAVIKIGAERPDNPGFIAGRKTLLHRSQHVNCL